jgi:hypothetical protein
MAHYPTGASKWNPIEHRLFSEVSRNWAGEPLDSYRKILNYARTTTTQSGLTMKPCLSGTTPSNLNCEGTCEFGWRRHTSSWSRWHGPLGFARSIMPN